MLKLHALINVQRKEIQEETSHKIESCFRTNKNYESLDECGL